MGEIPGKCRRQICWGGKAATIEVNWHWIRWTGRIPCTGIQQCLFCGKSEEEIEKEHENV